jgi:hypothetical protein
MDSTQIKPYVKEGYILLRSGKYLNLLDPDPDLITIEDISEALSKLCRFTGHTHGFYSVGEHSLWVARFLPDHLKLEGLLHDASEAYLGDVSSPLKDLIPGYRNLEAQMDYVIRSKFKLPLTCSPEVKRMDRILLGLERQKLLPETDEVWGILDGVEDDVRKLLPRFFPITYQIETVFEFMKFFRVLWTKRKEGTEE